MASLYPTMKVPPEPPRPKPPPKPKLSRRRRRAKKRRRQWRRTKKGFKTAGKILKNTADKGEQFDLSRR